MALCLEKSFFTLSVMETRDLSAPMGRQAHPNSKPKWWGGGTRAIGLHSIGMGLTSMVVVDT